MRRRVCSIRRRPRDAPRCSVGALRPALGSAMTLRIWLLIGTHAALAACVGRHADPKEASETEGVGAGEGEGEGGAEGEGAGEGEGEGEGGGSSFFSITVDPGVPLHAVGGDEGR